MWPQQPWFLTVIAPMTNHVSRPSSAMSQRPWPSLVAAAKPAGPSRRPARPSRRRRRRARRGCQPPPHGRSGAACSSPSPRNASCRPPAIVAARAIAWAVRSASRRRSTELRPRRLPSSRPSPSYASAVVARLHGEGDAAADLVARRHGAEQRVHPAIAACATASAAETVGLPGWKPESRWMSSNSTAWLATAFRRAACRADPVRHPRSRPPVRPRARPQGPRQGGWPATGPSRGGSRRTSRAAPAGRRAPTPATRAVPARTRRGPPRSSAGSPQHRQPVYRHMELDCGRWGMGGGVGLHGLVSSGRSGRPSGRDRASGTASPSGRRDTKGRQQSLPHPKTTLCSNLGIVPVRPGANALRLTEEGARYAAATEEGFARIRSATEALSSRSAAPFRVAGHQSHEMFECLIKIESRRVWPAARWPLFQMPRRKADGLLPAGPSHRA